MKRRALAVVLTLMMVVTVLPMATFAAHFSDTEGHWAESAIDRWTDEGVLQGIGDNIFAPNATLTRAQAAAIFTRLLKLTETTDVSQFTDVEEGAWYVDYVSYVVAAGIMNGTSATTFNPNGTISRQDFFLILARAVGIPDQYTCYNTTFEDLNQVSEYAKGAVYALINLGYVNGRSATQLAPLAPITRASAAKVLDNVITYYITDNGSYEVSGDGIALILAPNVALNGANFNGTVVCDAENGTVDMSGLKNPVRINVTKDGVNIVNAPANSATSGQPASETFQEPQPEVQPGQAPQAQGNTQPGQADNPQVITNTKKKAVLSISLGGFVDTPFQLSSGEYDANKIGTTNIGTLMSEIAGSFDEPVARTILDKFQGTQTYNPTGQLGAGYTVTMTKVDDNTRTITIQQAGVADPINYNDFLASMTTAFENQSTAAFNAAWTLGEGDAKTALKAKWDEFTATFSPASQISVTANGLQLCTPAQLVANVQNAAAKGEAFRTAALEADPNFNFAALMGASGIITLDDPDSIATVLKNGTLGNTTSIAILSKTVTAGNFDGFVETVQSVINGSYMSNEAAKAVWYAGYMDNNGATMAGTFAFSFSVVDAG